MRYGRSYLYRPDEPGLEQGIIFAVMLPGSECSAAIIRLRLSLQVPVGQFFYGLSYAGFETRTGQVLEAAAAGI